MKRAMPCVVAAAACALAVAEGRPPAAEPAQRPLAAVDGHDFLFLGDTRPVLIRLRVRIEGKPLQQAWDDFIDSLFRHLDRDGNGVLSEEELQRAPPPQLLTQLLRGNPSDMRPATSRAVPDVQ